jgi:lipoyl-dependent peroxiredoxin
METTMTQTQMTEIEKVLYTARIHTKGERASGVARSDDGRLDIKFSSPGAPGDGTNPEQLFGAGWSACYIGAMGIAARKLNVKLPADTTDDVEVDLCLVDGGYFLQARHKIGLPGLSLDVGQALIDAAAETCPYSKAVKGNIHVTYTLI